MLLLKQANVTTEVVRVLSTIGTVHEGCVRNAALQTSEAGARRTYWAEPRVRDGEGRGAHELLKIHQLIFLLFFFLVFIRQIQYMLKVSC